MSNPVRGDQVTLNWLHGNEGDAQGECAHREQREGIGLRHGDLSILLDQVQKTHIIICIPASSKTMGRYFSDASNKLRRMHTSGMVS